MYNSYRNLELLSRQSRRITGVESFEARHYEICKVFLHCESIDGDKTRFKGMRPALGGTS